MTSKLPQTPQTGHIRALSHDGRGIAQINGKTTFIQGALPNEEVSFIYTKQKSRFNEARLEKIITPSPARVAARCPHFGVCGGCSMQHMSDEQQLLHQQEIVLQQLKHFGKVEPKNILPPLTGDIWGYRRKARLGVRYVEKKGKLFIGFRELNTPYLTDIERCETLDPRIGHAISSLREMLLQLKSYKIIPQIEVAMGDKEVGLTIRHLEALTSFDEIVLKNYGKENTISIYLQPGDSETVHKIWPEDGKEFLNYQLPHFNLEYLFHPTDFIQINSELNRQMVVRAIELLELNKYDVVLDLFCGLGNFSLPIAQKAARVIGIEGVNEMVERASMNATHNNLTNTEFHAIDLTKKITEAAWFTSDITKILLDPPRSGAEEIIKQFKKLNVKHIVYVSCNPATFARDAGILVHQQGYRLMDLGILNMFPHTGHVETIAVFKR